MYYKCKRLYGRQDIIRTFFVFFSLITKKINVSHTLMYKDSPVNIIFLFFFHYSYTTNILLKKINWSLYFEDIVIIIRNFWKIMIYSESSWNFLSPCICIFSFVLICWRKIKCNEKNFITRFPNNEFSHSFWRFFQL